MHLLAGLAAAAERRVPVKKGKKKKKTRKRAIAKALQLKGHSDFAPVDLAYYQHFLCFFVPKHCVLGSSAWQPQIQTCLLNVDKERDAT